MAIRASGIPIHLEDQTIVADGTWPVRMGVPLPNRYVDPLFTLEENGIPVPLGQRIAGNWERDGAAKWIHLDFLGRWVNGQPAEYHLKLAPPPVMQSSLAVNDTVDAISVDTGEVQFEVGKAPFHLNGSGPYLVDDQHRRYQGDKVRLLSRMKTKCR